MRWRRGTTAFARPMWLCCEFRNAVVFAEHGKYPEIADLVSDLVYAPAEGRRQSADLLSAEAARRLGEAGSGLGRRRPPDGLPGVDGAQPKKLPRDVFAFVIHEGKVRAPAGAIELIGRLK